MLLLLLTSCSGQVDTRVEIVNEINMDTVVFKVYTEKYDFVYGLNQVDKVWLHEDKMLEINLNYDYVNYRSNPETIYFKDYIAFCWVMP